MSQTASARNSPLGHGDSSLRLLFEGLRDHAIFATDPFGLVTSWPANAEGLFGWSEEEALGKEAGFLLTPEDRFSDFQQQRMQQALLQGKSNADRWT